MNDFPIPKLARLPIQISPCPIVEAIFEIRFVTKLNWSVLPGMLFDKIGEKYPDMEDLPLSQFPEEFRKGEANLRYKPLVKFIGTPFLIQFGPRVLSVISNGDYPGWTSVVEELRWLFERLAETTFLGEGERLSMRYIDFFEGNVFPNLRVGLTCDGNPIEAGEMSFTTAFRRDGFTVKLIINNSAMVRSGDETRTGSVLDLDLWVPASGFDIFEEGLAKFEEAHGHTKDIFFGLLRPEFLASLSPEYP